MNTYSKKIADFKTIMLKRKADIEKELDENKNTRDKKLLEQVAIMDKGCGFGELALTNDNHQRRLATIKCIG